jgi:hypothetical protein
MTRRMARRFIPALVLASILGGNAISQAFIVCTVPCPIWDPAAKAQHVIVSTMTEAINVIKQAQNERLYKMSLRVATWGVTLKKYVIHADDLPEMWKIHNWFTDDVLFAKPFNHALSYGDANGDGYDQVVIPRHAAAGMLDGHGAEAEAALRSELAILDVADSIITRGTHTSGRLRYNGRAEADIIERLQADATDEDPNQSLTAVLDKVALEAVVRARNAQGQGEFQSAILEQLLLEQLWDRNADAADMNRLLTTLRAQQDDAEGRVDRSTDALRGWHLP